MGSQDTALRLQPAIWRDIPNLSAGPGTSGAVLSWTKSKVTKGGFGLLSNPLEKILSTFSCNEDLCSRMRNMRVFCLPKTFIDLGR